MLIILIFFIVGYMLVVIGLVEFFVVVIFIEFWYLNVSFVVWYMIYIVVIVILNFCGVCVYGEVC